MRLTSAFVVLRWEYFVRFVGRDQSDSFRAHTTKGFSVILKAAAEPSDALPSAELQAAVPRLRRYASVLTGDVHRADDLLQDTLARAWEKRRLWRSGSDLRAWLFKIMHNLHLNQFAMRRREKLCESLDIEGIAHDIPVRGVQFEHVALAETLAQLEHLPTEQRAVLVLAAVEEMTYEEIARVLDIPVGTVMSRLSRARAKLRRADTGTTGR
jgi:RNA polymerase sigma-70 factor (ECF subfamily)